MASKALTAYRSLQKKKTAFCNGKGTKAGVRKQANTYIKAKVASEKKKLAKGLTTKQRSAAIKKIKTDAERKAKKILNKACKVKPKVSGTRKRTTRKRRTTRRKRA